MANAVESLVSKLRDSKTYGHLNLPPTLYIRLEIIDMLKTYISPIITVKPITLHLNKRYARHAKDSPVNGYNVTNIIEKMPGFSVVPHLSEAGTVARSRRLKYNFNRETLSDLDEKIRGFEKAYAEARDAVNFPRLREKITFRRLKKICNKSKMLEFLDGLDTKYNLAIGDLVWLCESLNVDTNKYIVRRELKAYRNNKIQ